MEKGDCACKVCGDKASGKHYGVPSCDGCRGFFKRSIRRGLAYHCKESGNCVVDVTRRNQCQACRFNKCLAVNMKRDAVQHERAPRAPLPPTPCPSRRHGFGFNPQSGLVGHTTSMTDLPGYHLIYPQPTLPFPLGLKPPSMALPLNFFNYTTPFSASLLSHVSFPEDASSLLRLPSRYINLGDVKSEETRSSNSVAEDEVTSSEEASVSSPETIKTSSRIPSSFLELPIAQGPESVYECAAKLLFLTVKWARSIPSFLQLSFHDQGLLLEESWSDLFVLSAGEWVLPIDKDFLLGQAAISMKREILTKEVHRLQEIISRINSMRLNNTEFSCLKALTLFKPVTQELEQQENVELLQEQAHAMLREHCSLPETSKTRFGKLLLLLPAVHTLSKDSLEELLFRKTIGNICIERVLSDMLRNSGGGNDGITLFKIRHLYPLHKQ